MSHPKRKMDDTAYQSYCKQYGVIEYRIESQQSKTNDWGQPTGEYEGDWSGDHALPNHENSFATEAEANDSVELLQAMFPGAPFRVVRVPL